MAIQKTSLAHTSFLPGGGGGGSDTELRKLFEKLNATKAFGFRATGENSIYIFARNESEDIYYDLPKGWEVAYCWYCGTSENFTTYRALYTNTLLITEDTEFYSDFYNEEDDSVSLQKASGQFVRDIGAGFIGELKFEDGDVNVLGAYSFLGESEAFPGYYEFTTKLGEHETYTYFTKTPVPNPGDRIYWNDGDLIEEDLQGYVKDRYCYPFLSAGELPDPVDPVLPDIVQAAFAYKREGAPYSTMMGRDPEHDRTDDAPSGWRKAYAWSDATGTILYTRTPDPNESTEIWADDDGVWGSVPDPVVTIPDVETLSIRMSNGAESIVAGAVFVGSDSAAQYHAKWNVLYDLESATYFYTAYRGADPGEPVYAGMDGVFVPTGEVVAFSLPGGELPE